MSEAAKAVEEMNGVAINENTRPLKVIIANRYCFCFSDLSCSNFPIKGNISSNTYDAP